MSRKVAIFIFAIMFGGVAEAADFRLDLSSGLGFSLVQSRGEEQSESPGSFGASVEFPYRSRLSIGLEHVRTLALRTASTGVSLSGVSHRWYFWNPAPHGLLNRNVSGTYILEKTISPFFGQGLGFMQSSLLPGEGGVIANSVGLYVKASGGLDFPLWDNWGISSEMSVSRTIAGYGSILMLTATIGGFFFF